MWRICEERGGKDAAWEWVFVSRWFVWYVVLSQARLADHPVGDVDVHKLVSGSGQGLLHTPYTHKSQGQQEQPVPGDTLFHLTLSFFPACFAHSSETGTIFPTLLFFPRFTPFMSAGLLFYTLISFCTSQSSRSRLCVWLPLQSPWAWGPQKRIQAGFLLSALPIIVRLTISLSFSLRSDVSGKNKPLSYLHSPKHDRFIARQ